MAIEQHDLDQDHLEELPDESGAESVSVIEWSQHEEPSKWYPTDSERQALARYLTLGLDPSDIARRMGKKRAQVLRQMSKDSTQQLLDSFHGDANRNVSFAIAQAQLQAPDLMAELLTIARDRRNPNQLKAIEMTLGRMMESVMRKPEQQVAVQVSIEADFRTQVAQLINTMRERSPRAIEDIESSPSLRTGQQALEDRQVNLTRTRNGDGDGNGSGKHQGR